LIVNGVFGPVLNRDPYRNHCIAQDKPQVLASMLRNALSSRLRGLFPYSIAGIAVNCVERKMPWSLHF
jgi:hypothetical protein